MESSASMVERVATFVRTHILQDSAGVVAVSGGPDSVVLAHILSRLWRENRLARIVLAHLNHQLRGAESDADEAFVRDLPQAWSLPELQVQVHRHDVARDASATGRNLEDAARQARYRFLTEVATREGAAWVATGHTANDQAETVLHHFLRGSGLQGLAGMRDRRWLAPGIDVVRPLLQVRRDDVLAYLAEANLAYRIDSSNLDPSFTRNRLRQELVPLLERDYNPALMEVLGRTALQLRDIQEELTRQATELLARVELPRAGTMVILKRELLRASSPVLVREMLRHIWQREGWPMGAMGFADWDRAAALAHGVPSGQDFPDGVRMCVVGRVIQLERSALS